MTKGGIATVRTGWQHPSLPSVLAVWRVIAAQIALVLVAALITAVCYVYSPLLALVLPLAGMYVVLACTFPVHALSLALLTPVAEAVQVPVAGLGALSPTEAAFLVLGAGWVWLALVGCPGVLVPQPADYPLLALPLCVLPALAWGAPPSQVLRLALMWTAFFLVFLTVKAFTPGELQQTALALAAGGALLAVMGLLTFAQGGGADVSADGTSVSGRAEYGIPDPNYFAAYLLLAGAPLLGLVVARGSGLRWVGTPLLALIGLAIVATLSRG